MDLSQARDELRNRGFDGLSDARCDLFLNAGKDALEDYAPWPWLQTSASAVAPLTITDLKSVRYVWNTSTRATLRGADEGWLRDTFGPDLTLAGTAAWWYLDGLTTLNVVPADTSSTFQVRYIKVSDELSADGDTPLFPARLHQIWIDFAVVEAYMDSDEFGAAETTRQKAELRLSRVVDTFFNRNLQNPEEFGIFNAADS